MVPIYETADNKKDWFHRMGSWECISALETRFNECNRLIRVWGLTTSCYLLNMVTGKI